MKRIALLFVLLCSGNIPGLADNGHLNYLLHCRGCHTPTGVAVPSVNMPSLRKLGPLLGTAEGRKYILQIPGVAHTPLNNEEVAEVLNWIVINFNPDASKRRFTLFTAAEVAVARTQILSDPHKKRAQIQNGS